MYVNPNHVSILSLTAYRSSKQMNTGADIKCESSEKKFFLPKQKPCPKLFSIPFKKNLL